MPDFLPIVVVCGFGAVALSTKAKPVRLASLAFVCGLTATHLIRPLAAGNPWEGSTVHTHSVVPRSDAPNQAAATASMPGGTGESRPNNGARTASKAAVFGGNANETNQHETENRASTAAAIRSGPAKTAKQDEEPTNRSPSTRTAETEQNESPGQTPLPPAKSLSPRSTSFDAFSFLSSMNLTREDLFERNWFYKEWMPHAAGNGTQRALLPPMDVMTRYISQHSHQRLELEWNEACFARRQQKEEQQKQPARDQPAPNGNSTFSPPLPCGLDEGSAGSLRHRRYLVATYSCPLESGNRLHRFANGLLWAILTNRTFLWRYHNETVCEEYGESDCALEYNPDLIHGPEDCEGMLERNPWIPSYEEWREKLGFADDHSDLVRAEILDSKPSDATALPYDGVHHPGKKKAGSGERDGFGGNSTSSSNDNDKTSNANGSTSDDSSGSNRVGPDNHHERSGEDVFRDNDSLRLIRTGKQVGLNPGKILTANPANKTSHLVRPSNLERLEALRSEGIYFLYGMLFESVFTMDPGLDPPQSLLHTHPVWATGGDTDGDRGDENVETIFLHSRHPGHFADDYTWPDHLCLEKRFPGTGGGGDERPEPVRCHVYVMSDRPASVALLHAEVRNTTRCTSSSRSQAVVPLPGEHAPHRPSRSGTGAFSSTGEDPSAANRTGTLGGGVPTESRRLGKKRRRKKENDNRDASRSPSFRSEHGPRAGRGYWEDVALAVSARDGMIAFHMFHRPFGLVRTSTALVREIVEFRRKLEEPFRAAPHREFFECTDPWKDKKKKKKKKKKKGKPKKKKENL
ncbi:unnamed protein product [Pseudo-nitzschia multistriata]|uniref:Uncharacterized protein n=1 Tax=Pseudo-nitzschia multistriata TaxID=183589 RepID=A0A448Z3W5_9STRA|nr:unnamed protein product [Pseudo-nitzschia multistriata]